MATQISPAITDGRASNRPDNVQVCDEAWREVLVTWLNWNQAYEHITAHMYSSRANIEQLQAMMDQMDQLRRRAVEGSQALLDAH